LHLRLKAACNAEEDFHFWCRHVRFWLEAGLCQRKIGFDRNPVIS